MAGGKHPQIARIKRSGESERRVTYYAPFDGYVMELGVRQGAAVQPRATLFQIASLKCVWITADVPETQAGWISPGDPVEVTVPTLPGMTFKAQVDYLYPELMQTTRCLKVQIVVKNPENRLRPGCLMSQLPIPISTAKELVAAVALEEAHAAAASYAKGSRAASTWRAYESD